jgi:cysteine desulfurase
MPKIYLDYQSATPVRPEVIETMRPYLGERFGNPASLHLYGLQARDALKQAREQTAAFINAPSPDDIVFTADGTEAMNLAIKGVAWANETRGNHIVTSAIEHPGILRSIEFLEGHGFACTRVPMNGIGELSPAAIAEAVTDRTILIATHLANHELGTIQAVSDIGALAQKNGVPFYADAEAAAGWLPIDIQAIGASLLSFSPHRFYGPKGVGVLYRSGRVPLTPLLHGGEQESGLRAGVENVAAIAGAGTAAELARQCPDASQLGELQQDLWRRIVDTIPDVQLNGPVPDGGKRRMTNSLNISFAGTEGEGVALAADLRGLVIASGPACRGKALKISPTLKALGVDDELARANVLLSLGAETTATEVVAAAETLAKVVERLRSLND